MTCSQRLAVLSLMILVISTVHTTKSGKGTKKDVRDFTDRDFERLYEEWEENDDEVLEEDELPPYKRPVKQTDLNDALKSANSPEELMKMSKKGQSLMMFVSVGSVNNEPVTRQYAEKWTTLWQSSLYNNHIDVQVYMIDDDRAIFLFSDGSKAWEAKDFLLRQPQVSLVTIEGKNFVGPAHRGSSKEEL
ncbi:LDLR chaperone MESD [Toxocara canis]|uniref:LDLR chaperone MESD n=2 Tax=Toxocara canis TaxID=6265 RepID=A0A0B2VLD9_TOXCA|nr:LDLR chaperone MESD [Toxocara canis]VDM41434.1 unnamed protein product [Toxocara canis]